jgi:hypothetical protein
VLGDNRFSRLDYDEANNFPRMHGGGRFCLAKAAAKRSCTGCQASSSSAPNLLSLFLFSYCILRSTPLSKYFVCI